MTLDLLHGQPLLPRSASTKRPLIYRQSLPSLLPVPTLNTHVTSEASGSRALSSQGDRGAQPYSCCRNEGQLELQQVRLIDYVDHAWVFYVGETKNKSKTNKETRLLAREICSRGVFCFTSRPRAAPHTKRT